MKIKSFTVKNFRSITITNELPLYDFSILLGPNNEGKSNILKAFVMAQNIISSPHSIEMLTDSVRYSRVTGRRYPGGRRRRRGFDEEEFDYNWIRDFPIKLQKKDNPKNEFTVFTTVYDLSSSEKTTLKKITHKTLSGNLKFIISIGTSRSNMIISDTYFPKKPFKDILRIQKFINEKIQVQYISAIRTPTQTISIIDNMISSQIDILQRKKKYQNILNKIQKIQEGVLHELSKELTDSVSGFLPQVKKVTLESKESFRHLIRESTEVYVDDGANTLLEQKGDGIKSLMAISIIQYITSQSAQKKNIVLVIEEPESHLHPNAIHKLNDVLIEISCKNQVIISTHSPLLVNRSDVSRNILVDKSQATASKSISQIRKILGVKIADNLQSANLVILVEGEEDKNILKKCLLEMSKPINKAITQGIIAFDVLGGGSNLSYKISLWKNLLCDVYAFLDNDSTGIKSYEDAEDRGLISLKQVSFVNLQGRRESEIEDLINPEIYNQDIFAKFGVNLSTSLPFKNKKQKWSMRVKNAFKANGKPWNLKIESKIKHIVSQNIQDIGINGLQKNQVTLRAFVNSIEEYIEENKKYIN